MLQTVRVAAIYGPRASDDHVGPFQRCVSAKFTTEITNDLDAVLIFGGDGTIHRNLRQLSALKVPILPVPIGSGNDFASALGIHNPNVALGLWKQFLEAGKNIRAIDLGRVTSQGPSATSHLFCNVANLGIDADINRRANRLPRIVRANGGYIFSLFPELVRYQPRRVTLTCLDDDRSRSLEELATLIAFANGSRYGRGLQIAPQANMCDGLLDICFVRRISKLKVLTLFPIVYFGRHLKLDEVEYFQCRRVRVESDTPTDIYADGDFLCQTPAEIDVLPAALRVIA